MYMMYQIVLDIKESKVYRRFREVPIGVFCIRVGEGVTRDNFLGTVPVYCQAKSTWTLKWNQLLFEIDS
jgi:hypothetical protein